MTNTANFLTGEIMEVQNFKFAPNFPNMHFSHRSRSFGRNVIDEKKIFFSTIFRQLIIHERGTLVIG